jgi:hypothetical protein
MFEAKNYIIILLSVLIITLAILSNSLSVQEGYKGRDKKMGYCFDAAFDSARNRLYVVAGIGGMHVFEVSHGYLNFVTTFYDESYYRNIKISGDRAFVADVGRGLTVFDISGKIPVLKWKWKEKETETPGMGVHIEGNFAYLAVGVINDIAKKPGLYIFDISHPDSPTLSGNCQTKNAWDVWVSGKYAYVADFNDGLCVIDLSSVANPREVARVKWDEKDSCAEIIRGEDKYVYIAAGPTLGLVVINIEEPLKPKVIGRFKSSQKGCGEGLCIKDGILYLANGNQENIEENGLYIIDVHTPSSPQVISKCTFSDWVEGVCLAGNHVYITNTHSGVRSIDVSNHKKPLIIDHFGPIKEE